MVRDGGDRRQAAGLLGTGRGELSQQGSNMYRKYFLRKYIFWLMKSTSKSIKVFSASSGVFTRETTAGWWFKMLAAPFLKEAWQINHFHCRWWTNRHIRPGTSLAKLFFDALAEWPDPRAKAEFWLRAYHGNIAELCVATCTWRLCFAM